MKEVEYELIRIHLEERFRKQLKEDLVWGFSPIFNGSTIVNGFRRADGVEVGFIVLRWDPKIKDYVSQWYDYEDQDKISELIEEEENENDDCPPLKEEEDEVASTEAKKRPLSKKKRRRKKKKENADSKQNKTFKTAQHTRNFVKRRATSVLNDNIKMCVTTGFPKIDIPKCIAEPNFLWKSGTAGFHTRDSTRVAA